MAQFRVGRVAEEIKREITDIVLNEVKDPGIGFITITRVEVSPDLRQARVYFSNIGTPEERANTIAALERAQGFIRSELGKRVRLRYIPELVFKFDPSLEEGARVLALLEKVKEEKPSNE